MNNPVRIATRSSPLALWQAREVKQKLEAKGQACELVPIESTGDVNLTEPIYSLGISGVFTKQLDIALLEGKADLAVHSLKDVPTQLAEGLELAAVLERGAHEDVIVMKDKRRLEDREGKATIASSSLRRKAQWLRRYPNHRLVPIRGNVQTRLRKFEEDKNLDGIIFAKAGLERLNLFDKNTITLDWMLSAPAQGLVGIIVKNDNEKIIELCHAINHRECFMAGSIERQFMRTLQAGCSVPVSALAEINDKQLKLVAAMHSFDGNRTFRILEICSVDKWENIGKEAAETIRQRPGAEELLQEIRKQHAG